MKKNTDRDYKSTQLAAVLKENVEKHDSSINKARLKFMAMTILPYIRFKP